MRRRGLDANRHRRIDLRRIWLESSGDGPSKRFGNGQWRVPGFSRPRRRIHRPLRCAGLGSITRSRPHRQRPASPLGLTCVHVRGRRGRDGDAVVSVTRPGVRSLIMSVITTPRHVVTTSTAPTNAADDRALSVPSGTARCPRFRADGECAGAEAIRSAAVAARDCRVVARRARALEVLLKSGASHRALAGVSGGCIWRRVASRLAAEDDWAMCSSHNARARADRTGRYRRLHRLQTTAGRKLSLDAALVRPSPAGVSPPLARAAAIVSAGFSLRRSGLKAERACVHPCGHRGLRRRWRITRLMSANTRLHPP